MVGCDCQRLHSVTFTPTVSITSAQETDPCGKNSTEDFAEIILLEEHKKQINQNSLTR
jgi:hypothetical protein